MRWIIGAATLLAAGQAQATATFTQIDISGVITSKFVGPDTQYLDSPIDVGSPISVTMRFDPHVFAIESGNIFYDLGELGNGRLQIDIGPYMWRNGNDFLDASPIIDCAAGASFRCRGISSPFAQFDGDTFLGFSFLADNGDSMIVPDVSMAGFSLSLGEYGYFPYFGPNFTGALDPASAVITVTTSPVPEPATWAMLVAGFGIIGMAARRRQGRSLGRT